MAIPLNIGRGAISVRLRALLHQNGIRTVEAAARAITRPHPAFTALTRFELLAYLVEHAECKQQDGKALAALMASLESAWPDPRPEMDPLKAIDWAVETDCGLDGSIQFLRAWRAGGLDEWPDYVTWARTNTARAA